MIALKELRAILDGTSTLSEERIASLQHDALEELIELREKIAHPGKPALNAPQAEPLPAKVDPIIAAETLERIALHVEAVAADLDRKARTSGPVMLALRVDELRRIAGDVREAKPKVASDKGALRNLEDEKPKT